MLIGIGAFILIYISAWIALHKWLPSKTQNEQLRIVVVALIIGFSTTIAINWLYHNFNIP